MWNLSVCNKCVICLSVTMIYIFKYSQPVQWHWYKYLNTPSQGSGLAQGQHEKKTSRERCRSSRILYFIRAAMFLIPILGINFLLLPIRPAGGSSFEYFYDIVSTIFSSFQGAFTIPILCFSHLYLWFQEF